MIIDTYSYCHLVYQPISTDWNTVTEATYNLIIDTLQQHCVVCWLLCVNSHCVQWGLSLVTVMVTWCTSPYQLTGTLWQEWHITWSFTLYSMHCVVCWLLCVSSHCVQWGLSLVTVMVTWCTSPYQLTGTLWQEWHITWSLRLYSSTVWFVDCCVSIAIGCSEGSHLLQLWLPGVPAHINWLEHCDRSDIFDHWHFTAALCGLLTTVCQ